MKEFTDLITKLQAEVQDHPTSELRKALAKVEVAYKFYQLKPTKLKGADPQ
jgi:hypothetical protein